MFYGTAWHSTHTRTDGCSRVRYCLPHLRDNGTNNVPLSRTTFRYRGQKETVILRRGFSSTRHAASVR